ncbi:MAG: sel1 repeat family protein [Candidatus Marinimicrobia bacterium]|nr:sel1 repeat family protein [Candidatus Neomarinimicrobiota bacterium]
MKLKTLPILLLILFLFSPAYTEVGVININKTVNKNNHQGLSIKTLQKYKKLAQKGDVIALKSLTNQARQGDAKAQFLLGELYHCSGCVLFQKDGDKSFKWLTKAADQGHYKAKAMLESLNTIDKSNSVINAGSANKSIAERLTWDESEVSSREYNKTKFQDIKFSAEIGNPAAQYNLGLIYIKGEVLLKDMIKATYWIKKAYEEGNTEVRKIAKDTWNEFELWKYQSQLLGDKDLYNPPDLNKEKNSQAFVINKVSEKTVITCIGNLYDMGIAANGRYADNMESYWEDVTIIGDVLTAPKFGDYLYRGEQDGKKYWKTSTGEFETTNPADKKWNWAVLDTKTDEFDISIQEGTINVMQGKCSPKNKTNWNWN